MKTNYKSIILSLGLAVMGLMFFNGANAQVADGDYSLYDASTAAPTNIDYVTLKTGGTTMGYYALPDPIYHPDYNAMAATLVINCWICLELVICN